MSHESASGPIWLTDRVSLRSEAVAFSFARGGGPGGQNVNKLATRVTVTVLLEELAKVMPGDAVDRLQRLAGRRYAADPPRLVLTCAQTRSQWTNRRAVLERLGELVAAAMRRPVRRVKTRPTRAAKARRVESKARRSRLKKLRTPPGQQE